MMPSRSAAALVAIIVISGVVACNSDRAYAPPATVLTDRQVSNDVAVSEGEAAAADIASLANGAGLAGVFSVESASPRGAPADLLTNTASECTYASGRWSCLPTTENGLTVVRSYAYFDAAGQPMKVKNDLTTASMNFQASTNGTVSRDTSFTGAVHRTRNVTVSGLLGAETTRRWDGFGASADTNTHRTALTTRTYAGRSVDSLRAVVYPQPRTATSYPLSGSMVRVVNYLVTSRGREVETRSVNRRVVITYNGTVSAQIQSGSVTCTLHLDTHKVDGCTG